jgi:hypothetical protein
MHSIVRSSQICKRTRPVESADYHMKATSDTKRAKCGPRTSEPAPAHYNTITANSPRRHTRGKQTRISVAIFLSRITYIAYTRYVCESWSTASRA